jgi:hypothetical protein
MKRKFEGILSKEKDHNENLVIEFKTVCNKHKKESAEDCSESKKTTKDIKKRYRERLSQKSYEHN